MSYIETTHSERRKKQAFRMPGRKRNIQTKKGETSPSQRRKHISLQSHTHDVMSQNFTSNGFNRNIPKYNQYLAEKTHTTADSEAGVLCTMSQLLGNEIEKKMQEHVKSGMTVKKGEEYQRLKREQVFIKFEAVSAIQKWAHDDYYVEEIWDETMVMRPLFEKPQKLQQEVAEVLEPISGNSFSSSKKGNSSSDNYCDAPVMDNKCPPRNTTSHAVQPHVNESTPQFDHTKEAIRIPIFTASSTITGSEIALFLQNYLRLPYSTLNNTLCPVQLSFTSCVDFLSVSAQSALLVFDGGLDSPDVDRIIKRLEDLIIRREKIGILGPNKSIIFGDPVIVRIASDNNNNNNNLRSCSVENSINESLRSSQGAQIVTQQSNDDMLIDLNCLPDYRHTCIVRNIPSIAPMHRIIENLDRIQKHGFINYTSLSRHGHHLTHAFGLGKLLMNRRYHEFLLRVLDGLASDDCSNLGEVVEMMVDKGANPADKDWKEALIRCGDEVLRIQKGADKFQKCGFNPMHSLLFEEILKSGLNSRSHGRGKSGDPAKIIRESIHRNVIIDILQAVSDVHWNAYTSLRLKMYGLRVVPGDLVIDLSRKGQQEHSQYHPRPRFDVAASDCAQDFCPTFKDVSICRWGHYRSEVLNNGLLIKTVESESEAKEYKISDVVLPKFGRVPDGILSDRSICTMKYPTHRVNEAVFKKMTNDLDVMNLPELKLSPWATYRKIIEVPKKLSYEVWNEERNISEVGGSTYNDDSMNKVPFHKLYRDFEGIRRLEIPKTSLPAVARRGIIPQHRQDFCEMARKGSSCVVQCELPRGACFSSLIRETFSCRGLPRQILQSVFFS